MNKFIEKNKGLLKIYCITAQISGLLLVVAPVIGIVIGILTGSVSKGHRPHIPDIIQISYVIQAVVLNCVFLGLVALCVAQFIKYVFESQDQPGLLLRIGDKILYVYAGLVILGTVLKWVFQMMMIKATAPPTLLISFVVLILPAVVKALILIGLGKILHRVMPVIEESKTLV
jgi:hypothetical protein